jgi:two-component system NtrC family sensor kinase
MNQNLITIFDFIQQNENLSADEKDTFSKTIKEVDIELAITAFKLDRTEKVKRTTAILLEETIDELEQKRKAIEETNLALQKSLEELNSTQSQLIQSEKMASLGELTAGIAHEIQNPLNFVNNFSEVSTELVDEMKDELAAGNWQLATELADDVKQNLEKINHHGKRAADIVKGMLQHSRNSSGVKEPTNINVLADEYLRLAYHGWRAKDKLFNATIKTDFDETLPKINVIPQDIGRVILNLITNAFYAVQTHVGTRHALSLQQPTQPIFQNRYEPTVTVCTITSKSPSGDLGVKISVRDNGPGIPAHIVDKIFQPFFTTKPTGQGTGLGLSLSYDIVKAHGGELKVVTKVGEGTEFIIQLPIQTLNT